MAKHVWFSWVFGLFIGVLTCGFITGYAEISRYIGRGGQWWYSGPSAIHAPFCCRTVTPLAFSFS